MTRFPIPCSQPSPRLSRCSDTQPACLQSCMCQTHARAVWAVEHTSAGCISMFAWSCARRTGCLSSLRTTDAAPRVAATMPTRPQPAPSSRQRCVPPNVVPAQRARCCASISAAAQTQPPSPRRSSPVPSSRRVTSTPPAKQKHCVPTLLGEATHAQAAQASSAAAAASAISSQSPSSADRRARIANALLLARSAAAASLCSARTAFHAACEDDALPLNASANSDSQHPTPFCVKTQDV